MTDNSIGKYLKKTTQHYVNKFLNEAMNVKPLKNPDYIRFTNQERTQGVNSDGQLVTVANIIGNPMGGGKGTLIAGTNTYTVEGPRAEQIVVDGNPENAYVLYRQGSPQTFFVQKGDNEEKFFITNLLTPVANTDVKFAVSGKHILLYVIDGSPFVTTHIKWQIIKDFTLNDGVCSGTTTTGTVDLTSLFNPIPPVPPVAPANADWIHNPLADSYVYTSNLGMNRDKIKLIVDEENNAYFFGSVNSVRFRTGHYAKLTPPFPSSGSIQIQTQTATLVRWKYNTNGGVLERVDDGTRNVDWDWGDPFTPWGGPVETYSGNWALLYPAGFIEVYAGKNGTTAARYNKFGPFIPNSYFISNDWFSIVATEYFDSPIAFTDVLYITAPTPFNSSTVKATNSREFLTYVTDDKLTRYREVDGSYTTKDFPIYNELTGIHRDHTIV